MAATAVLVAMPAAAQLVDEAHAQTCKYSLDILHTLARRLREEKEREQRQALADATAKAERVAAESARAHAVVLDDLAKVQTELADLKEAARAQEASKLTTELADAKAAAEASVERENAERENADQVTRLGISTKQAQAEQAKAEQAKAEADVAHEKDLKDLRESLSSMQADFQSERATASDRLTPFLLADGNADDGGEHAPSPRTPSGEPAVPRPSRLLPSHPRAHVGAVFARSCVLQRVASSKLTFGTS